MPATCWLTRAVGLIGLGLLWGKHTGNSASDSVVAVMGMAGNLVAKGFTVFGYARETRNNAMLASFGAKAMESVATVAAQADIVFVMVVKATQTRDVVAGAKGLLETLKAGSIIVITATIGATLATPTKTSPSR